MNCPQCGNKISDNAKFCPQCGTSLDMFEPMKIQEPTAPVVQTPTPAPVLQEDNLKGYGKYDYKRAHPDPPKQPQYAEPAKDMQTQLARQELDVINKNKESDLKVTILSILLLIIVVLAFWAKAFGAGLFFLVVLIGYVLASSYKKKRRKELTPLANGKKIVNVCPKCKSDNIEMAMVQTGAVTSHGTTRVSDNINPLHPFTHTNVSQGTNFTSNSFGNQCHCKNCGYVFAKPEVHYV